MMTLQHIAKSGYRLLPALVLTGLLLTACSTSPNANFYTLSSTPVAEDLCGLQGERVQLQTELLHFPDLLSQPQIATRPQPFRIEYAEFHRWAGSLESDFLQSLGGAIQQSCSSIQIVQDLWPDAATPEYQLYLDVSRFDGTLDESVSLTVNWVLKGPPQGVVIAERQSRIVEPVVERGYVGLVAAQSRAVTRLARQVASGLQLPK